MEEPKARSKLVLSDRKTALGTFDTQPPNEFGSMGGTTMVGPWIWFSSFSDLEGLERCVRPLCSSLYHGIIENGLPWFSIYYA